MVGLGGRANRQYAQELAERGFVTLSPAYTMLANYWPDLKKLGHTSGTMKAIWDNIRGLDYLSTLKEVDTGQGFGAIGHSLGGHNSVYTAVFDERIKVVVSSCGLDSYLDYYGGSEKRWFYGQGWCQDRYMAKLADYRGRLNEIPFDFHEMVAALAPRLCLSAPPKVTGISAGRVLIAWQLRRRRFTDSTANRAISPLPIPIVDTTFRSRCGNGPTVSLPGCLPAIRGGQR